VENIEINSAKVIDPSRSFKFNDSILIISNEKVLDSIKNTQEYLSASTSSNQQKSFSEEKNTLIRLINSLEEALKIQKKADFSSLLDFSNVNNWDSEVIQFLK